MRLVVEYARGGERDVIGNVDEVEIQGAFYSTISSTTAGSYPRLAVKRGKRIVACYLLHTLRKYYMEDVVQ